MDYKLDDFLHVIDETYFDEYVLSQLYLRLDFDFSSVYPLRFESQYPNRFGNLCDKVEKLILPFIKPNPLFLLMKLLCFFDIYQQIITVLIHCLDIALLTMPQVMYINSHKNNVYKTQNNTNNKKHKNNNRCITIHINLLWIFDDPANKFASLAARSLRSLGCLPTPLRFDIVFSSNLFQSSKIRNKFQLPHPNKN